MSIASDYIKQYWHSEGEERKAFDAQFKLWARNVLLFALMFWVVAEIARSEDLYVNGQRVVVEPRSSYDCSTAFCGAFRGGKVETYDLYQGGKRTWILEHYSSPGEDNNRVVIRPYPQGGKK